MTAVQHPTSLLHLYFLIIHLAIAIVIIETIIEEVTSFIDFFTSR